MAVHRDAMEAAIHYFIQLPITPELIFYVAHEVTQVVPEKLCPLSYRSPRKSEPAIPSVLTFVGSVIKKSGVQMSTLVTSLVYLNRVRLCLSPATTGKPTSAHRLFLAALILAAKSINDISPKNKHWARYSLIKDYHDDGFGFSLAEVNLMEYQLLSLLDWNIRVSLDDLYCELQPVLDITHGQHSRTEIQPAPGIKYRRVIRTKPASSPAAGAASDTMECNSKQQRLRCWHNLRFISKVFNYRLKLIA
jgi:G1/S-specific cyclin PLC1